MNEVRIKLFEVDETGEIILFVNGKRVGLFDIYNDKKDIGRLVATVMQYGSMANFQIEFDVVDDESDINTNEIEDTDTPDHPLEDYFKNMFPNTDINIRWIDSEDFDDIKDDLDDLSLDDLDNDKFKNIDDLDELPGFNEIQSFFASMGLIPPRSRDDDDMDDGDDDIPFPQLPFQKPVGGKKRKQRKKPKSKKKMKSPECIYSFDIEYKDEHQINILALGRDVDVGSIVKSHAKQKGYGTVDAYLKSFFENEEEWTEANLTDVITTKLIKEVLKLDTVERITQNMYSLTDSYKHMKLEFSNEEEVELSDVVE